MNKHRWITEVLDDIGMYAEANGLMDLANAVLHARSVAQTDMLHFEDRCNYDAVMAVVFPAQR